MPDASAAAFAYSSADNVGAAGVGAAGAAAGGVAVSAGAGT